MILVLGITSILLVSGLFGTSYAYYVSTDGTTLDVTTANIDLDNDVTVIFNQTEYINFKVGVPILAADVDTKANTNTFTITSDSTKLSGYDVAVNISLVNLEIADSLKISDFKYDFACKNGNTTVTSTSGTGASFTNSVLTADSLTLGSLSTSGNTFTAGATYNCTFRVWLQESNSDQNALMNKKFTGLIKVVSAFRK